MQPTILIPSTGMKIARRVRVDKIHSIISNRVKDNEEQFLVQWKSNLNTPPLSWHGIQELVRCLEIVQDYITARESTCKLAVALHDQGRSPGTGSEDDCRASPFDRLRLDYGRTSHRSLSPSMSSSSTVPDSKDNVVTDVYNGRLDSDEYGFIFARSRSTGPDVVVVDIRALPTDEMIRVAQESKIANANVAIRAEYVRRLQKVKGKKIHIVNSFDYSTPSLRFRYIDDYVLRDGVFRADIATQEGCQNCSAHMGRNIGCEYTKRCDCLEYAAVDEARLTSTEMIVYQRGLREGGSTMGLPKRFPYYCEGTKYRRSGTLVPFYLDSRRPIYECNDNCKCGRLCRNKNVQFGRLVEVEIFKTDDNRGWGLRCKEDLYMGQFVDTYRGEVITDEDATRREEASGVTKASYLYSLDKHAEAEGLSKEEIYVVDGEFMGGPSKFMNHSCQPNCRQYTVSYNKHDLKIYDLAFFAIRDIAAGEELTFDYLDKEEADGEEEAPEGAVRCLCNAPKCRKWLWQ